MLSMPTELLNALNDPMKFQRFLWPDKTFYDKQIETVYSVRDADETFVPAANMAGKDFVAGFICVAFILCPHMFFHPSYVAQVNKDHGNKVPTRRIVTTSVKEDHLTILWAEITKFLTTARFPLLMKDGGPLALMSMEVRLAAEHAHKNPNSYLKGMVSSKEEGLTGWHAPYTLLVGDEASGLEEFVYDQGRTCAKKILMFGNCNPCGPNHFFRKAVDGGDILIGN